MSVATPPPPTVAPGAAPAPVDASCPLCGTPLDPAQEWCLTCGAAARTRLAAPTNWKGPVLTIAVIAALALGVLAAALVKLSEGPGRAEPAPPVTRTVLQVTPGALGTNPGALGTTPGATTTGALPTSTAPGGVAGLGGTPAPPSTSPVTPGTPTTIAPSRTTSGSPSTTPSATAPTAPATTPANTNTSKSPRSTEEELRRAGFTPRTGK